MQIFEFTEQGKKAFNEAVRKLEKKENYLIAIIEKEKSRSYEQNNWYWGFVIPSIMYFLKDDIHITNKDVLHDSLKLIISQSFYSDKLYTIKDIKGNEVLHSSLSTAFDKMSRKLFNQYLDNLYECLHYFINWIPYDLNELVLEYCKQVGKEYKELK